MLLCVYVFDIIYVALPALVANMAPVLAARLKSFTALDTPIHAPTFGNNKTWRGIVVGVLSACVIAFLQFLLFAPHFPGVQYALTFGILAGIGALGGDLMKSYFKRLLGIANGRPFIPFDQIDYMVGFLLCTYSLYQWSLQEAALLLIFALIANPVVNAISYACGIKKTYW